MTWTDARVETLTSLWGNGLSASLIAAQLGDTTRNAVIGKVQRLALASRKTAVTRRPPRTPRPALPKPTRPKRAPSPPAARSRKPRTRPPRPAGPPPLGPAPPIPVTIFTVTPAICNWPEGDPKRPDFHFCGRDKPGDKPHDTPYCPHHAARAYR